MRFPWTNYSITQQEKTIFNLLRQVYLEGVQRDRFTRLDLPRNGIVVKAFEVVDAIFHDQGRIWAFFLRSNVQKRFL